MKLNHIVTLCTEKKVQRSCRPNDSRRFANLLDQSLVVTTRSSTSTTNLLDRSEHSPTSSVAARASRHSLEDRRGDARVCDRSTTNVVFAHPSSTSPLSLSFLFFDATPSVITGNAHPHSPPFISSFHTFAAYDRSHRTALHVRVPQVVTSSDVDHLPSRHSS